MNANYDSQPGKFQANGNGSYTYRWDIKEVTTENENGETTTTWQCNEVVVWATVTREKLTAKVIEELWDNNYETKLVNDYNAANLGIFDADEAEKYIKRYQDFLIERNAIKEQIAEDCLLFNIQ
jgi:hypothetical protein